MSKSDGIWLPKPEAQDYKAAHDYLTLLFREADAARIVKRLRAAPIIQRQAKDLIRASQTHRLPESDLYVANDLKKIRKGKKLSPVLLVRGDARHGVTLTIADGYHRICASWYWSEDEPVSCCLVNW